jgi:hypothetical protein
VSQPKNFDEQLTDAVVVLLETWPVVVWALEVDRLTLELDSMDVKVGQEVVAVDTASGDATFELVLLEVATCDETFELMAVGV